MHGTINMKFYHILLFGRISTLLQLSQVFGACCELPHSRYHAITIKSTRVPMLCTRATSATSLTEVSRWKLARSFPGAPY